MYPNHGEYRVYADGVFDMAHVGHFKVLEQAKKALGNPAKVHLLCGVCNDEDVMQFKGKVVWSPGLPIQRNTPIEDEFYLCLISYIMRIVVFVRR